MRLKILQSVNLETVNIYFSDVPEKLKSICKTFSSPSSPIPMDVEKFVFLTWLKWLVIVTILFIFGDSPFGNR